MGPSLLIATLHFMLRSGSAGKPKPPLPLHSGTTQWPGISNRWKAVLRRLARLVAGGGEQACGERVEDGPADVPGTREELLLLGLAHRADGKDYVHCSAMRYFRVC